MFLYIRQNSLTNNLMANWFETNQTKTIIVYTLFIVGATWAFYKFTFEENKIELYKAQVESKQSEISQYRAKIEFLEKENANYAITIKEFEDWNAKSQNPALFYKSKFEEIVSLKQKFEQYAALNTDLDTVNTGDVIALKSSFPIDAIIRKGNAYINDKENIVIALNDVNIEGNCNLTMSVGAKKNDVQNNIKAGTSFQRVVGKKILNIIVSETDFITSKIKVHIVLEENGV